MTLQRPGLRSALVALILSGAAPARAMVGATAAEPSLATSTVMVLSRQGSAAGFCSGIVLSPVVVLTAAHCVPKGADIRVHLPGPSDGAPTLLPVSGVARSPGYRPDAIRQRQRSIDLALIHLSRPMPDPFVPAALARSAGTRVGARFVAAGFGVAREGDAPSSGKLRSAVLAARAPLSDVLLWAEDPVKSGVGACTGDSGGPVVAEGSREVVAVLVWSAGEGAHACGSLTQAAWLAPQKPWIDRVMEAWQAQSQPRP